MNTLAFTGSAVLLGDDIDTDAIIPARYLFLTEPKDMAAHCFEETHPDFRERVAKGRIVVAGENFGCGSSREHAPVAIMASGALCVVARSFSRLFLRNAINIGLPVLEVAEAGEIAEGDALSIDMTAGTIRNATRNKTYSATPLPPFIQELLLGGGAIPYLKKRLGV